MIIARLSRYTKIEIALDIMGYIPYNESGKER